MAGSVNRVPSPLQEGETAFPACGACPPLAGVPERRGWRGFVLPLVLTPDPSPEGEGGGAWPVIRRRRFASPAVMEITSLRDASVELFIIHCSLLGRIIIRPYLLGRMRYARTLFIVRCSLFRPPPPIGHPLQEGETSH
jgi:hypothetical protein